MTKTMMPLYAAGLFVLGAIVALGGEQLFFRSHDQRDKMETIGALQDWRLTCQPRTMKKGGCLIQSGIMQKGTNNVVAELSISQKDKTDELAIVAPLGVFIPAGVQFGVGSISKTVQFKTCLTVGCVATLPMDSALSNAMATSAGGAITLVGMDGKSVAMNFSLRGYNDAIAARAVDMAARD